MPQARHGPSRTSQNVRSPAWASIGRTTSDTIHRFSGLQRSSLRGDASKHAMNSDGSPRWTSTAWSSGWSARVRWPGIETGRRHRCCRIAGTHVVEHLLDIGRPVEAWVHRKPERDPGCRYRVIDIRDRCLRRGVGRSTAIGVIHLAAITSLREAVAAPEYARQVNVHGTHNMLAPLSRVPAVFSSTCHVYGSRPAPA